MTYTTGVRSFGLPAGYVGTSMAAPHVSATAALVIASGLLGPAPAPDAIEAHLKATARDLGRPGPDRRYGAGLVDAAAATAPGVTRPDQTSLTMATTALNSTHTMIASWTQIQNGVTPPEASSCDARLRPAPGCARRARP